MRGISANKKLFFAAVFVFGFVLSPALADWQKMDPPPDVDKSTHGHTGQPSCWLAAAANMLAGAGYGDGNTVQDRADDVYLDLVTICKAKNSGNIVPGWTDTAINWWFSKVQYMAVTNPYTVVTVHGNKTLNAWMQPNCPRIIGNHLRTCNMVGVDIFWSSNNIGHVVTAWGDNGDANALTTNPTQLKVSDSDKDFSGDVQTYIYDSYANGWPFNYYFTNHPAIRHIITLTPADINDPCASIWTQTVRGSYMVKNTSSSVSAVWLHYEVGAGLSPLGGTSATIYNYRTGIDWPTGSPPSIAESSPRTSLVVDCNLLDNPVPPGTWVKIETELVIPAYQLNLMQWVNYSNVYFGYPLGPDTPMPGCNLSLERLEIADTNDIPNIRGGHVVGAFDFFDDAAGTELIGQYRFQHEYDYFQDPEFHEFSLEPVEDAPACYVGNFRFGHSYGCLDDESLWEFDEWMTEDPNLQRFETGDSVWFSLDWEDELPYPEGNNYIADPNNCGDMGTVYLAEDLNQDCYIDFRDLAYFAGRWLNCTDPNNANCDAYWK